MQIIVAIFIRRLRSKEFLRFDCALKLCIDCSLQSVHKSVYAIQVVILGRMGEETARYMKMRETKTEAHLSIRKQEI